MKNNSNLLRFIRILRYPGTTIWIARFVTTIERFSGRDFERSANERIIRENSASGMIDVGDPRAKHGHVTRSRQQREGGGYVQWWDRVRYVLMDPNQI